MKKSQKVIAYIDAANLHRGVSDLGWKLDYARFRTWLTEKYNVTIVYLFIGLIPKNNRMYTELQKFGYTLIFKDVVYDRAGKAKGNCDAELVLQATRDFYEKQFDKAILVSSDGDYAGLVSFLNQAGKIEIILSPANSKKCSILLKRTAAKISYLSDQKTILQGKKEKAPNRDKLDQGLFRGDDINLPKNRKKSRL